MGVAVQRLDRGAQRARAAASASSKRCCQSSGRRPARCHSSAASRALQRLGLGQAAEDRERAVEGPQRLVALAQRARRRRPGRSRPRRTSQKLSTRPSYTCGPGGSSSRRRDDRGARARQVPGDGELALLPGRRPGAHARIVPATRATTGAGRRCTSTLSWSRRITGSVTRRPCGPRDGDRARLPLLRGLPHPRDQRALQREPGPEQRLRDAAGSAPR